MWLTPGVKTVTPVNKEAIRVLVIQHGQREAARIAGLNENTVRSWAMRYKWSTPTAASKTQPNGHSKLVERLEDTLSEHERETRLSLARYARRAAKDAEQLTVREAPLVHKVTQVAGLVHKWQDEKSNQTFTLNVLNINSLDSSLGTEEAASDTLDA